MCKCSCVRVRVNGSGHVYYQVHSLWFSHPSYRHGTVPQYISANSHPINSNVYTYLDIAIAHCYSFSFFNSTLLVCSPYITPIYFRVIPTSFKLDNVRYSVFQTISSSLSPISSFNYTSVLITSCIFNPTQSQL